MKPATINLHDSLEDFDDIPGVELEEDVVDPLQEPTYNHGIELEVDDVYEEQTMLAQLAKSKPRTWLTEVGAIEDYADVAPKDWIHRGILMEGMSTVLVAREGIGKSLLAVNLANAVANGSVFLGQTHKPRPVLYLDLENPYSAVEKRAKEFNIRSGGNLTYVGLYTHGGEVPNPGISVKDPAKKGQMIDHVRRYVERQWKSPLIVLDSLVRFMPGNENDTETSKAFWERIKPFTGAGCSFLILHHAGKGETSQEGRGSTDITAGCDIKYVLKKPKEGYQDTFGNLRKLDARLARTRFPENDVPLESILHVDPSGVWTQGKQTTTKKEAPPKNHVTLRGILQANPGISTRKFTELALSRDIGRTFADKWRLSMIGSGNLLVEPGAKRAELLTWNDDGPEVASKSILPNMAMSDSDLS